jgi:hypothetical protein
MEIIILLGLLIVLDVTASCWGYDSRTGARPAPE